MTNSNEYMAIYTLRRYHERRRLAIEKLGGKCAKCGSVDELEFDHIDPKTKNKSGSEFWSLGEISFQNELTLCQLLCKDCHKAKSSIDNGLPHGGGVSGKGHCPCKLCKSKKAEYMKDKGYNKKRKSRAKQTR